MSITGEGILQQPVDFALPGDVPGSEPSERARARPPLYPDNTVCIVDHGLFSHLAETIAPDFGRTLYFSHWQTAYPKSNSLLPGAGIEGVERISHIWPHLDSIDLFVFPDIFDGALQLYLRSLGKRVWGSGMAERLETNRAESKQWMRKLGLPVGKHAVLRGTNELRLHLQRHDDQFVKLNTRGDAETFHSENYDIIEPRLDELDYTLGAKKDYTEFVSEDAIPASAEVGFDGFTVDGQFPAKSLWGVESKDCAYVGQVAPYNSLPRGVTFVNQKLSPLFKQLKYRGFWSSEIRIAQDGTSFLIDPCCRLASPPGELFTYLVENAAEVLWEGAGGNLVEPRWKYPFGAQLILRSGWAETGWQPIEYPAALAEHVKLHYYTKLGGRSYYVPQQIPMPEIGAVVAGGNTRQEAIENVIAVAEQVKGYDVKFDVGALEKAAEDMESLAAD